MFYIEALLIGILSGFRALTPVAVVSWAAWFGRLHLAATWLSFLSSIASPITLTVLALGEIVNDKLPKTPSRKAPPGFIARLVTGGLSGAAIGASNQNLVIGLVLGVVGAVLGTLGGYEMRSRLAKAFGKDLPAALLEDAITIIGSLLIAFELA
jgi:uncharacterized membrane protein